MALHQGGELLWDKYSANKKIAKGLRLRYIFILNHGSLWKLVVKITKSEQGSESDTCLTFISLVLRAKCVFDGVKAAAPWKHHPVTLTLSLHCPVLVFGRGKCVEMCLQVSFIFPYFCSWNLLGFCLVPFAREISVSFVKCAFWGLFPLLPASIKTWLHLEHFMVQVVKMFSVSVLRKDCYHLSFCMELVDWQLCQWPLVGSESSVSKYLLRHLTRHGIVWVVGLQHSLKLMGFAGEP